MKIAMVIIGILVGGILVATGLFIGAFYGIRSEREENKERQRDKEIRLAILGHILTCFQNKDNPIDIFSPLL